jgi:hypothetical protein
MYHLLGHQIPVQKEHKQSIALAVIVFSSHLKGNYTIDNEEGWFRLIP